MEQKYVPLRTCIGCRQVKHKAELIRIVRQADGCFATDKKVVSTGRGAYICMDRECVTKALKRGGLNRAFKDNVSLQQYEGLLSELTELIDK